MHIPYSCPDFDTAIEHIESARKINSDLRDENEELQNEINELENKIAKLDDENDRLRAQLEKEPS